MKNIRQYAKENGHTIIGKLTRRPEWEIARNDRWYIDEAGNEYFLCCGRCCIVTADGAVI